mmetsp:Transcript_35195/g.47553  ORF Transcript_35195/g.47553 Transcript_35195/m.47553 type:complete len:337 (-) Transcript_35195:72-1082(-)|eukprot:CAMPEP_0185749356 /NCGR_PEP_ID=MMETSP1174-20130828/8068_1 /TAXON_ID=35687 /ORGANISM="Dictyocha speculum, Strain CCMP1381" /LENGTH=336 /DNA_ID=CAMNT_0028425433 /DNA_START=13 /DNA_END=1023 /DNA_ORIENTATION=+
MTKKTQPLKQKATKGSKINKEREAKVAPKRQKARVVRALKNREPKVIENPKKSLFLKGNKTSELCSGVLKDMSAMRAPLGKTLQRRNPVHPMDDANAMEFLCEKNDCSLFVLANHSKKRPHNLVFGRTFDGHILDMVELGIMGAKTLADQQQLNPNTEFKRLGSKPMILFLGEKWEAEEEYRSVRNLLLDFFRAEEISQINLASLDHVIVCTAANDMIYMRTYMLHLKKPASATSNIPNTRLYLSAPSVDFKIRRCHWASIDLWKASCKRPRELKPKKVKNISTTSLGDKVGKIHIQRQDISELQTRKVKALRASKCADTIGNAVSEKGERALEEE